MCARSLQSCLTLRNPVNCSLPGSSLHGILQARTVEWVSKPSSRGSSWPRDQIHVSYISCMGRQDLYHLGSPRMTGHLPSNITGRDLEIHSAVSYKKRKTSAITTTVTGSSQALPVPLCGSPPGPIAQTQNPTQNPCQGDTLTFMSLHSQKRAAFPPSASDRLRIKELMLTLRAWRKISRKQKSIRRSE